MHGTVPPLSARRGGVAALLRVRLDPTQRGWGDLEPDGVVGRLASGAPRGSSRSHPSRGHGQSYIRDAPLNW